MPCRRDTTPLASRLHYSPLLSLFLSAAPRCAALRERQARSRRDLVTLLPVMSRVRSTFLFAPVAPPALLRCERHAHMHTHNIHAPMPCTRSLLSFPEPPVSLTLSPSLPSVLSLFLFSFTPPPPLILSASRARALGTAPQVLAVRNVHHPIRASCSPPLPGAAIRIGEVPASLHEITSLPLDFTFAEDTPVRSSR